MTPVEFETILDDATAALSEAATSGEPCRDSKAFEHKVLTALKVAAKGHDVSVDPTFHPHAFPDIAVNGFGVEVKHTTKDSWLAVGNSVFEGQRDESVTRVYVVYGKMGGMPAVRWARYEDCVTHVRISHAPRFVIEMDRPAPLFSRMGIPYDEFRLLSPEDKMRHIREYSRGRLKPGERLWWLEDREEPEHSLPIAVRIYRTLADREKRQLRAEAALLCPEIVQSGARRGKYDRAGMYLITQHGVFTPQLRDLFSAGSVGARDGSRGHKYIITALRDIEAEMIAAAQSLDDDLFVEYWEESCDPDNRISTWIAKADEYAEDWMPSDHLFRDV